MPAKAGIQEEAVPAPGKGSYMEVTPRFGFKDYTVCLCATGGLSASATGTHG
jgi:hypothetical protein